MSEKTFLLIAAGPSQAASIAIAHKLGCKIIAVDGDPNAPGLKMADEGVHLDIKDVDGIAKIARDRKVDGIFSVACEVAMPVIGELNEILELPGMSYEKSCLVTDKGKMRECYQAAGIPCPAFHIFDDESQLTEAIAKVGFPSVIKPVDSSGSRGVSYVENEEQLRQYFNAAKDHSGNGRVILESYMPGIEVSVEAFVHKGEVHILTLSDKVRTRPPYLLDTEVNFPSAHPVEIQNQIKEMATRAIKALGIDDCPIHMEQLLTPDGPRIVELAARGPGFQVYTDMIPYVTGVNGVESQLKILMGLKPDLSPFDQLRGACLRFFGGQDGVVRSITGVEEAAALPGIHDFKIYVKPGDKTNPLTCGPNRIGHLIVFGENRREACELAATVFDMVKIEY